MTEQQVIRSIEKVAGANARALRQEAGLRLQDVAAAVRRYGPRWSTGSVSDFESGRTTLKLSTLLIVVAVLNELTGAPLGLDALLAGDELEHIELSEELSVPLREVQIGLLDMPNFEGPPRTILGDFVETDRRLCKRIGIPEAMGATVMELLWGKTFTARRDQEAGVDGNPQRRGQVARRLQAELLQEVNR